MVEIRLGGAASITAALILFAGAAGAEEHTVIIFEQAYFPDVVYAQAGDTIVFSNASGAVHTVTAKDADWTTGPIQSDTDVALAVMDDMQSAFGGESTDAIYIEGSLTFDPPPNN